MLSKVRACNRQMPASSLFDACLLNPGNWISSKQRTPDHAHIHQMAQKHAESITQLIYRILHAQGSRTIGTGQLSSRRYFRCNRGPAADRGTPRLRLQTDRCSGRARGTSVLQAASCGFIQPRANQLLHNIQVASFHPIYALCPLLLLFSPLCPPQRQCYSHQASPRDCCDSCDIRALNGLGGSLRRWSSRTGVLRLCGLAWPIAHSLPSTSPQRLSGTVAALPKVKMLLVGETE